MTTRLHGIPREFREVVQLLVHEQGWVYLPPRPGRHPQLRPPDGTSRPIAISSTPSDRRSFKNWLGQLRRAGARI